MVVGDVHATDRDAAWVEVGVGERLLLCGDTLCVCAVCFAAAATLGNDGRLMVVCGLLFSGIVEGQCTDTCPVWRDWLFSWSVSVMVQLGMASVCASFNLIVQFVFLVA